MMMISITQVGGKFLKNHKKISITEEENLQKYQSHTIDMKLQNQRKDQFKNILSIKKDTDKVRHTQIQEGMNLDNKNTKGKIFHMKEGKNSLILDKEVDQKIEGL